MFIAKYGSHCGVAATPEQAFKKLRVYARYATEGTSQFFSVSKEQRVKVKFMLSPFTPKKPAKKKAKK